VPSKDPIQRFEDIPENVALIEEFTAGMDLAGFTEDLKTSDAAERCLVGRFSKTYPPIWLGIACVVGQDGILCGDWQSPLCGYRQRLRQAGPSGRPQSAAD
jgi:hypothetical protein